MEISRRHLQDTERAELSELLQGDNDAHSILSKLRAADVERMKDQMVEMPGGALDYDSIEVQTAPPRLDAAEMQRQVDGLTRNQRRVLVKRMKKHRK